jgi:hypothetical protein
MRRVIPICSLMVVMACGNMGGTKVVEGPEKAGKEEKVGVELVPAGAGSDVDPGPVEVTASAIVPTVKDPCPEGLDEAHPFHAICKLPERPIGEPPDPLDELRVKETVVHSVESGADIIGMKCGGESWAVGLQEGEEKFLILNGEKLGPYDYTFHEFELFDDGKQRLLPLKGGAGKEWYVLVNGKKWAWGEKGGFGLSYPIVFGKNWFLWTTTNIVVSGKKYGPYKCVACYGMGEYQMHGGIHLHGSSGSWAFEADQGGKEHIIINGKNKGSYKWLAPPPGVRKVVASL